MKIAIAFAVIAVCGVLAAPENKYTTKYDSVDIDQVLRNDRLLNKYVKCLIEGVGCTPDANELRNVLSDALATECSKCSDVQKEKSEKVFRYVYNNRRDIFDKLAAKYDPNGQYKAKYSKYAEEKGIKL